MKTFTVLAVALVTLLAVSFVVTSNADARPHKRATVSKCTKFENLANKSATVKRQANRLARDTSNSRIKRQAKRAAKQANRLEKRFRKKMSRYCVA